jgi:hypothetical protein
VALDIGAWLKKLGLEQYEGVFRDNAIDAEVLPDMSEADFEKLEAAPQSYCSVAA